ncbi:MAG: sigma-70 family RNA polymerase sigma factor [Gemmataceae bacterium]|nr:sigma-70 family RNA polymerase sigma factor [Gemmataceae bacterium]
MPTARPRTRSAPALPHEPDPTPQRLLDAARAGDPVAWGELLEHHRPYLTLLAEVQLGRLLRVKADPADLVQDALLRAHNSFSAFRGTTAAEFAGWLREVLASRLAKLARRYCGTGARDVRLERDLRRAAADSSRAPGVPADPGTSPSGRAARGDEAVRVAAALGRLPPDQRRVVVLRQVEGLRFAEVADRMGRTKDAVTQLWLRALRGLRDLLEAP